MREAALPSLSWCSVCWSSDLPWRTWAGAGGKGEKGASGRSSVPHALPATWDREVEELEMKG